MNNCYFVKYKDLLTINNYDEEANKEGFVLLPAADKYVFGKYIKGMDMLEYGEQIPVRKIVFSKLINASKKLKQINSRYKLMVVYGYREMKKQEHYFYKLLEEEKDRFDDEIELYEYIHEKVAVPIVSGHPTGGAMDIAIYNENINSIIDFGTDILDFSTNKCYYNNEDISKQAKQNRMILRKLMLEEGFAPYDGEWWHFSFGDKEWAFYYKKDKALFNQISDYESLKFE